MKYQLVVQYKNDSIEGYDALIGIEDLLVERLSEQHEVDGHDVGADEMNIFILTDDFKMTFDVVKAVLEEEGMWEGVRVAYRDVNQSTYTILWPLGLQKFEIA
jgi:hypothetical protein